MRLAIGSDHRGLEVKKLVIALIEERGDTYRDFGAFSEEAVDYPDIAGEVARAVTSGDFDRGILICGTGIGMCMAANKFRGIRAAQCHNAFTAMRARRHNDANVLCLGAEEGKALVPAVMEKFLTEDFEGGRHQRRLDKIRDMEGRQSDQV
ncbi:MAG: ribose 5-phosphate isomerase B [Chloroflexota bacterium]